MSCVFRLSNPPYYAPARTARIIDKAEILT